MLWPAPNPTIVGFKRMAVSSSAARRSAAMPASALQGPTGTDRHQVESRLRLLRPKASATFCWAITGSIAYTRNGHLAFDVFLEGVKGFIRDFRLEEAEIFQVLRFECWHPDRSCLA